MIVAHGVTHPGKVRRQNEDAVVADPAVGLFIVADGMGGENAGEVASRLAVETMHSFITRSAPASGDHSWPFGIDGQLELLGNRLRTAVKLANRTVFRESESQPQFTGMGTTVAAVLLDGARAAICGIGDSRVYMIANGALTQMTRDHTWVAALLAQNPGLTPEALAQHPMRHVLTSVVGAQSDVDVPIGSHTLERRQKLLLCSDGVHRALSDEQLCAFVEGAASVNEAAERIVAAALDADGSDNLSALVVARE